MQVKKQQLEPDIKQWIGSKLVKEYVKAIYCHPAYLTYMQSTSCEMLGLMNFKLESRLPGEILIVSDIQMAESEEELKSLLMKVKEKSKKSGLRLNIQNTKIMSSSLTQFSSVAQSCPTLCDPMNRSTPGLLVHHQLPEFTQTHIH